MTTGATSRFSQLHNFHYGYLGEDWYEEYGSVERALAGYLREEDVPTLARTVQETDELLVAPDFDAVCNQLTQYFRPTKWTDDDMRAWVSQLRDRAQAEIRARASAVEGR